MTSRSAQLLAAPHPGLISEIAIRRRHQLRHGLVVAVAQELVRAGFADHAHFFGASAYGGGVYVEGPDGVTAGSDIDVLISIPISSATLDPMRGALAAILSSGGTPGDFPMVRISLKVADETFQRSIESKSLLWAAYRAGRTARQVQELPWLRRSESLQHPRYPYALPYGILRFLELARLPGNHRTCALYELAKGLVRHAGGGSPVGDPAPTRWTVNSLTVQTMTLLPYVGEEFGVAAEARIRRWVQGAPLSADDGSVISYALANAAATRLRNSLLSARVLGGGHNCL